MTEEPYYPPTIRERNSAAQAALGRVRALANEWELAAAGAGPRNYAGSLFSTAARDLRRALGGA